MLNSEWLTRSEGGMVRCNLCQSRFTLPPFLAVPDMEGMQNFHWPLLQTEERPSVVMILRTNSGTLVDALADFDDLHMPWNIMLIVCGPYSCPYTPERRSCLARHVEKGLKKVKEADGKLVLVWDHNPDPPPRDGLEALMSAAHEVRVDVVSVGMVQQMWHPALIRALSQNGGALHVVNTKSEAMTLLHHPSFLTWGVRASLRVVASPGVRVVRACGRGLALRDGQMVLGCLAGRAMVGLELELNHDQMNAHTNHTHFNDNRIHIQIQLFYTNLEGRCVMAVFSRCFTRYDIPYHNPLVAEVVDHLHHAYGPPINLDQV